MANRPKAGNSVEAKLARQRDFVRAYIANGRNGEQAAVAVGYSNVNRGASHRASRMLREPAVRAMLDKELAKASRVTGLTLERTLLECARMAYSDPGRFYRADGTMKPVIEWDDDMRAAVAQLETEDVAEQIDTGTGGVRTVVRSQIKRLKFWPKAAAIDMAMKHLGAYERDNAQRSDNLTLQVLLVGGPK